MPRWRPAGCVLNPTLPATDKDAKHCKTWSAPGFVCALWGRNMRREAFMGNVPRKVDGRRVFSTDLKQATLPRILTSEKNGGRAEP